MNKLNHLFLGAALALGCSDSSTSRRPELAQSISDATASDATAESADAGIQADAPADLCRNVFLSVQECLAACEAYYGNDPEQLWECHEDLCIDEFVPVEGAEDCCDEQTDCYLDCDSHSCFAVCEENIPTEKECCAEEVLCGSFTYPPGSLEECREAWGVPPSCY